MSTVQITTTSQPPMSRQAMEYVERKGLGHPDTICDSVMESISVALANEYLQVAGRVLHANIDKGLLVAGQTTPNLGGGRVVAPMRLIVGDRATSSFQGQKIPVADMVRSASPPTGCGTGRRSDACERHREPGAPRRIPLHGATSAGRATRVLSATRFAACDPHLS